MLNIYDSVSNVYDADLLVVVQDCCSLEKIMSPCDFEEEEEEEYFRWFVRMVNAG